MNRGVPRPPAGRRLADPIEASSDVFIFFPVRTDSPIRRQPYANVAIIAANVLIFLLTDVFGNLFGGGARSVKQDFVLDPQALELHQFISYQFLHGDYMHLLGNMVFLWVFGNSVCSKMGNFAYALFYLSCGVFAGTGFAMIDAAPCLGASGAIAGITTAYLVLFPRSEVTIFYWLWLYIGQVHIRAMLLIGVKVILYDNIIAPRLIRGGGEVEIAYSAHLAGYAYGFIVALFMLLLRALPRDQYDILAVWKRAYQRAQMRTAMADPNAAARAQFGRVAQAISPETGKPIVDEAQLDEIGRLRLEVAELLNKGEYAAAAERWEALTAITPGQCLSARHMLAIANQLATTQRYSQAAATYETYLRHYPTSPETEQVRLMLGIIYARYLQQYEPARRYLTDAAARLTNPQQREQATHWLQIASSAGGGSTA